MLLAALGTFLSVLTLGAPLGTAAADTVVIEGWVFPTACPDEIYDVVIQAENTVQDDWVFTSTVSPMLVSHLLTPCEAPGAVAFPSGPVHWIPGVGGCPVSSADGTRLCLGPMTSRAGDLAPTVALHYCLHFDVTYCYDGQPTYTRT